MERDTRRAPPRPPGPPAPSTLTVDLLVCGSRRRRAALRRLLDSTSDHLARHTRMPLLIAPHDDATLARWRARQSADRALDYAAQIADDEHAELHVVHIVEKIVSGRVAGQNAFLNEDQMDARINAQARQVSDEHGIQTTVHMTPSGTGNIADRIAEIATDAGADLVVVGTRGHSAIGGLLLGSVTQLLMHVASCPVLAVPPIRVPHTQPTARTPAATTAS